jgi:hypothetical protein
MLPALRSSTKSTLAGKLETKIGHFDTSGRSLIQTVLDLAYEYQLPLGIEYVDRAAITRPIDRQFHDQTLRNIFDELVTTIPDYRVAFAGDTVQIYSARSRADSSNLLNTTIKDFSVASMDTGMASFELKCALTRQLESNPSCGGASIPGGPLKLTFHLQNAKVYEILNTLITQDSRAIWIVTVPADRLSKRSSLMNLWRIYPLDPSFKEVALQELTQESR